MPLEITAIVCGTIVFLWMTTLLAGVIVARKAAKTPPPLSLEEYFDQAKSLLADIGLK